jgi:hypothetical protein
MGFLRALGMCVFAGVAITAASCSSSETPMMDASVMPMVEAGTCPNATECNGVCVVTKRDFENCGACGHACKAGEVCVQGGCALQCGGGATKCSGACVSTQSDPANCGSCAYKCGTGLVCNVGKCAATCQQGLTDCNSACVDLTTDDDNCGKCGVVCDAGKRCSNGQCKASCQQGWTSCADGDGGTTCVDLQTDSMNCGNCGTTCPNGQFCAPSGDGGAPKCDLQCFGGTTLCNGKCVDTQIDSANCGGCGVPCGGACSNAHCCAMGESYCGGMCKPAVQCAVVYSKVFTTNQNPPAQHCTDWTAYRAAIPSNATSITIKGSQDTTGLTCTGSAATQIVQNLIAGNTFSVSCNGKTWSTGNCSGIELSAEGACTCGSQHVLRPCIPSSSWGGVGTTSCGAPTQTMTVEVQ